jgi:hypothetical protein
MNPVDQSKELPLGPSAHHTEDGVWHNFVRKRAAFRWRIALKSGTVIEGLQAANEPLRLFPMGDVASYEIDIDEVEFGPKSVKDE